MFSPRALERLDDAVRQAGDAAADAVAKNEDFWRAVQEAFNLDARYIALNGGANNSAPRMVHEAFERYASFVNGAPLTNQPIVLGPLKETLRARVAGLAGCSADEIAFTRNATEALNIVIRGLELHAGDEVLVTALEYDTILNAWRQRAQRDGIVVRTIPVPTPVAAKDDVASAFERAIGARTRAIMLSHIVDSTGEILPVQRVARIAQPRGIQVLVDGALGFGQIGFDLGELGCDYYGTSLHKWLYAPLGTGFLYVKRERIASLWPLFGAANPRSDDIRKLESVGRQPVAALAAVGQALDFHESLGVERIRARLQFLKRRWTDRLSREPNVRFHSPLDAERSCATALVEIQGIDSRQLYTHLLEKHRIQAWPIVRQEFQGLWVAPHLFTRVADIDRFAEVLARIARTGTLA
jgi:selenocysteine lyase/cysteine desulfurase